MGATEESISILADNIGASRAWEAQVEEMRHTLRRINEELSDREAQAHLLQEPRVDVMTDQSHSYDTSTEDGVWSLI